VQPVTFGIDPASGAKYVAGTSVITDGLQTFPVSVGTPEHRESMGEFALRIPGAFNVMNALAAASAALELGAPVGAIRSALADFTGIWRRFEQVGTFNGARLVSDYGHHPTAVSGTLDAAASFYPKSRLVLAFQPHHHNRTRKLFNEFVASFDAADVLILCEVYDVAGRENPEEQVSSRQLIEAVQKRDAERGVTREIFYAANAAEVDTRLREVLKAGDTALIMGAGDIYTVAKTLPEKE
jgi:UDP-N-acetylmuramate--alanine ligase